MTVKKCKGKEEIVSLQRKEEIVSQPGEEEMSCQMSP